jgi:threonine dehydrogenase-like Zn-dependent dehydrogenase
VLVNQQGHAQTKADYQEQPSCRADTAGTAGLGRGHLVTRPFRHQRKISHRCFAEYGPFDLIIEGTGYSPLVFESMNVLAKNGVLAMVSVTGGSRKLEIPADQINLGFVLGNKIAFGSVNANREYFESGVKDLSTAELQYPGWLKKLLTRPVKGLENYGEMMRILTRNQRLDQSVLRSRGVLTRRAGVRSC